MKCQSLNKMLKKLTNTVKIGSKILNFLWQIWQNFDYKKKLTKICKKRSKILSKIEIFMQKKIKIISKSWNHFKINLQIDQILLKYYKNYKKNFILLKSIF